MQVSVRSIYRIANRHLRYFSEKVDNNSFQITRKQWVKPKYTVDDDSLKVRLGPSTNLVKTLHKLDIESTLKSRPSRLQDSTMAEEEKTLTEIMVEEVVIRGNSVSAAQFLLFNGASVRFSAYPGWIRPDDKTIEEVPKVSESANYLEAIEMLDLNINYSTLRSLRSLENVSFLRVKNCPNFDAWCVDHITGNFPALEEVEISNCPLVTAASLGTLHRLTNLHTLKLFGFEENPELELTCILLEEHFKKFNIEGISYSVDKVIK